mmetsp:Transcript_10781/g.22140  ORF Transcript_10781/g.22140 Transcript_10781/m.22140 type:complete len:112 (-) Transcript_10781:323-658(-)
MSFHSTKLAFKTAVFRKPVISFLLCADGSTPKEVSLRKFEEEKVPQFSPRNAFVFLMHWVLNGGLKIIKGVVDMLQLSGQLKTEMALAARLSFLNEHHLWLGFLARLTLVA